MFVLRPSSPFRAPAPVPQDVHKTHFEVTAARHPEPFIDEGPPLPEEYDTDIIRALLQDPFRVFIYWIVREGSLRSLTRFFSFEDASTFRIVLKLADLTIGNDAFFEVSARGRYWMLVFPDRVYQFEIGLRSPAHGYISLVRSNRVQTPRGTVSAQPPQEEPYRMDSERFVQVLEASGFAAEQTMSIAAAAARHGEDQLGEIDALLQRLPESLRTAILAAASTGELNIELIEALPEPLRSELLKLLLSSGGRVAAAGLMHYVPELLREVTEDDLEWIGGRSVPFHLAPRFFIGGTENVVFPGAELRWPGLPRRLVPGSTTG